MNGNGRELTGRKVLIIAVSAFAVVLAANLAMLFAATGTFPGLVVENSYRAGVGWNDRAAEQAAHGWTVAVAVDGAELRVKVTDAGGAPVRGLAIAATVGRPATDREDRRLLLAPAGGIYRAPVTLSRGLWRVEIAAEDGAQATHRSVAEVFVRGDG